MMEEQMNPLAITHLLQHTLRSLCIHDNSQWVYAVFWRILPRNYPPPKWDGQGAYDRSRGNRRNWILVWEDGFCNFAASTAEMNSGECPGSSVYGNCEFQHYQGLQPELFFKMSHEIYNYGEGLIGKVAADQSHKWIHKEPNDQEINFLSTWHNSADSHPRTWEAQFQSGIKTIALIAVREGVVQLGAVQKVIEDLSYVVLLRKKFSYIESIPGVLLPHPSSANYPFNTNKLDAYGYGSADNPNSWHYHHQAAATCNNLIGLSSSPTDQYYIDGGQFISNNINQNDNHPLVTKMITPSMSSLEALLSKLPSVVPPLPALASSQPPMGFIHISDQDHDHQKLVAKEEEREDQEGDHNPYNHRDHHDGVDESSNSFSGYPREQYVNYHHPHQF